MRFVLKTPQITLVTSQFRKKNFERNLATEPQVLGKVNFTHPAGSQHRNDLVMFQLRAGSKHSVTVFRRHLMPRSNFNRKSIVFGAESRRTCISFSCAQPPRFSSGNPSPPQASIWVPYKTWLLNVPAGKESIRQPYSIIK